VATVAFTMITKEQALEQAKRSPGYTPPARNIRTESPTTLQTWVAGRRRRGELYVMHSAFAELGVAFAEVSGRSSSLPEGVNVKVKKPVKSERPASGTFEEQHYSIATLARRWAYSTTTVRDWFIGEPGLLVPPLAPQSGKRRYRSLRIPESMVARVYAWHTPRR
jgi:hypothetical protein